MEASGRRPSGATQRPVEIDVVHTQAIGQRLGDKDFPTALGPHRTIAVAIALRFSALNAKALNTVKEVVHRLPFGPCAGRWVG
jgi:hypothetical protein